MKNHEQNHEMLESQLRSWTPRPPSDRVARRLFGRERKPGVWEALRAPDLWQWLSPVAAGLVTIAVFLSGGGQRPIQGGSGECATFYATVMAGASHQSNSFRQTFAMNRSTVNMEWNVIPGFSYDATNPGPMLPAAVNRETNMLRDQMH